jgi:hypothetical protein
MKTQYYGKNELEKQLFIKSFIEEMNKLDCDEEEEQPEQPQEPEKKHFNLEEFKVFFNDNVDNKNTAETYFRTIKQLYTHFKADDIMNYSKLKHITLSII